MGFKHLVLPLAIDLGICAAVRLRAKPGITAYAETYQETADFTLVTAEYTYMPKWASYLAGVAILSVEAGSEFSGLDVVVHGNLLNEAGLSSSAALTTAMAMAIQSSTGWSLSPVSTARLCQAVEHRFAGVQCGVMDQMACRMCQENSALFIDCATFEAITIPIPPGQAEILFVDSGVSRSLSTTDYNTRRHECEKAVLAIQSSGFNVKDLRGVTADMFEQAKPSMPTTLIKRSRHVLTENERVLASRSALEQEDFETFGQLMNESHDSLRFDFEVSVDELDHIVSSAIACDGVYGARLTGAGFGGNAIVLTKQGFSRDVERTIKQKFEERFGRVPRTHCIQGTNEAEGYAFNA